MSADVHIKKNGQKAQDEPFFVVAYTSCNLERGLDKPLGALSYSAWSIKKEAMGLSRG
jgi:hypothetical protein